MNICSLTLIVAYVTKKKNWEWKRENETENDKKKETDEEKENEDNYFTSNKIVSQINFYSFYESSRSALAF